MQHAPAATRESVSGSYVAVYVTVCVVDRQLVT